MRSAMWIRDLKKCKMYFTLDIRHFHMYRVPRERKKQVTFPLGIAIYGHE